MSVNDLINEEDVTQKVIYAFLNLTFQVYHIKG